MKNKLKKMLVLAMSALLVIACVACGNENAGNDAKDEKNEQQEQQEQQEEKNDVYTINIKDADTLLDTLLPEEHVGDQEFEMILSEIIITVTFGEDGNYTYHTEDISKYEEDHERWMHREYEWTGTYTKDGDVYTLDAPTKATKDFEAGSMFEKYQDIFGAVGSFTEADDPELLDMFLPCTATVEGDTLVFDIL